MSATQIPALLVTLIRDNPQLLNMILPLITKLLQDYLAGATKPVPTPNNPVPKDVQPDKDFPDDTILGPAKRSVGSVKVGLARVQLSRQRFPEEYTDDNPFGLFRDLDGAKSGSAAIPYGSKVWIDLTPYDQDGQEIKKEDAISLGLAYDTKHVVGGASITGKGGTPGNPKPYETVDTDEVGNGITAWKSTNGFLHQVKVHEEGTYEVTGFVAGVKGETFSIRVS